MALTKIGTSGIKDDAVTTDKLANAINTERTANTAKDLTALSAANLTSGTIPDARFPATLPAISGANLTGITAAGIGAIGGLTVKNQGGSVVGTGGSISTLDFNGSSGVNVTATSGASGIATILISSAGVF